MRGDGNAVASVRLRSAANPGGIWRALGGVLGPHRGWRQATLEGMRGSTVTKLALAAIVTVAVALLVVVQIKARADWGAALADYRHESSEESRRAADEIAGRLRHIHQGLRTIGLLPSVRNIDRHAENIDADARQSIQQLYNNLKFNVDVSEVYIVSADINPERIDPTTGAPQAPILMFDELIVNAAARARAAGELAGEEEEAAEEDEPEVEIYEYRALREQMTWLRAHYPTDANFANLERPMLSTPEHITCDNTLYIHTHLDADRSGIILSVPFYGLDGALKGTISAIVRTGALTGYLPERDFALLNTAHNYRVLPSTPGVERASVEYIDRGAPNPDLLYSGVVPLDVGDAQGRWLLWSGRPDAAFLGGDAAGSVRAFERVACALIVVFAALSVLGLFMMRSHLRLQRSNRDQLQEIVQARTAQIEQLQRAQTEIAASEARAKHLAYHDALTGLPNRALLWDRLAHALEVTRRGGQGFAVHCIDLDQFKGVNDTFGHQIGDELIRTASAKLAKLCRKADTLARLGGDEFAVVQLNSTPASAAAFADRIVAIMAEPIDLSVGQVHVGCSVGVTMIEDAATDPLETLRQADLALYRAKGNGRGQYAFFESEMDAAVRTRRELQTDLKIALAKGELELAYQPQVNGEGAIVGVEALLRWTHKQRGVVPPGLFVPIAEESGLIVELGFFVLRRAFEQGARWPHIKIAVNVSAHQIRMKDFVTRLAVLIRETGAIPANFELEITEGVLLGDDPCTHATLQALRDVGFSLALDDFGTGYSSLSYLQRYPVDKIKIDRSFVANLGADAEAEAVISAIVKLAGALNLRVIAEGVETMEQRTVLSGAGCSEVQGYLYGRPMTAEAIDKLVGDHRAPVAVAAFAR